MHITVDRNDEHVTDVQEHNMMGPRPRQQGEKVVRLKPCKRTGGDGPMLNCTITHMRSYGPRICVIS